MDEILQQLVPLLLNAVPTILVFLVLVVSYKLLLHDPLLKVLAERRARTEGAIERADAAIAAAEAKAQEYEAKLRAARAEIFQAREARVKTWNDERESALEIARHAARERVQASRADLAAQTGASKEEIRNSVDSLAADILKAVLPADSSTAAAEVSR